MSSEVERLLGHYLFYDNSKAFLSVDSFGIDEKERAALLKEWYSFERPDIYTKTNATTYGLEHFEYDAHHRSKKGSLQHRENIKIKQSVEEEIRDKFKTQDAVTSFRELKSKANEEYYKSNFIESFKAHYSKVSEYKKHLLAEFRTTKNISIWFIAEDMTPLGSYFVCRNRPKQGSEPAFPLYFPEIEKLFLNSEEIDGIIFADNCNKVLTLVKRNEKSVEELKNYHHYSGEPLFFFEPKIASTAVKIFSIKE